MSLLRTVGLAMLLVAFAWDPGLAQEPPAYTNLQVLPADISRDELLDVMLDNLHGLGLPRRSGEGCLYCHVGSTETPRSSWDYASDDNPMKAKARVMMRMVAEINEGFLARLDSRVAPDLEVSCQTCHAGRTDPSPLPDLLLREYNAGGIEALEEAYRVARARYYERDTYDFRVGTLVGVGDVLAGMGKVADAARALELNIEFSDSPQAWGALIRLRLSEALQANGPAAMIARGTTSSRTSILPRRSIPVPPTHWLGTCSARGRRKPRCCSSSSTTPSTQRPSNRWKASPTRCSRPVTRSAVSEWRANG